nr:glucan 1,3-beta-glucosidase [Naematelia aurantialba]
MLLLFIAVLHACPVMSEVHLVVLVHGLWGSPAHLAAAKGELERAWTGHVSQRRTSVTGSSDPTITTTLESDEMELVVMIAGGMTSQLTYDGIDVCASRVAYEVDEQIDRLLSKGKKVTHFSVTGYSLGGLVARYLIGLLQAREPCFFDEYKPFSFSTIATPHLGIPRYNTLLSTVLCWLGARLLSRSGEQLYVADQYSEEDPRPLLEIMADPSLVFFQALSRFEKIHIFANGVNDTTVPYPSSAIEVVDHFAEWETQGLMIDTDEADIIRSWSKPSDVPIKRKTWSVSIGTLPPVLRYRFPFNYIILLLFPIMLPLVVILMTARLSLDTRRSRRRLQQLAQAAPTRARHASRPSSIPSASGLSVQGLREAIRRVERSIESDLIATMDTPDRRTMHVSPPVHSQEVTLKVRLSDSQLRMALWLNALPLVKFVSWYPDVTNSHAVSIVRWVRNAGARTDPRDPIPFPAHLRGRGLLKRWARGVLGQL